MTRDEAINIIVEKTQHEFPTTAIDRLRALCSAEVDGWVALGMLKLDEPKSYASKIEDAMSKVRDTDSAVDVSLAFESAGLRIIEK